MPPSDEILKAFLMMDRNLRDEAVPEFVREFTATMAYAKVADQATIQDMEFGSLDEESEDFVEPQVQAAPARQFAPVAPSVAPKSAPSLEPALLASIRKEIFALDEGDVVLTFPDNMSEDSYKDLEAHLQLFLRKAKRRAASVTSSGSE